MRRLLRHGDRSKGGAGTDREQQPAEKLHPDGAMATLVPPTRLPALGSGDALAAAAVLGVSLGAHEGAAMWDALHGQSLWDVLSAAARTGGPASSAAAAFPAQDLHTLSLVGKGGAVSARRGSAPAAQPPPTPMPHELADGGGGISFGGPSTGGLASLAPWDSSTVAQQHHAAADRTESVAAMLVDGDAAVRQRAVLALGKLPPQLVESQLHALLRCLDDPAPSVRRRPAPPPRAAPRRRAAPPRRAAPHAAPYSAPRTPHPAPRTPHPAPRTPTALPGAHRDARRPRCAPRRAAAGAHGAGARAA